MFPDRNRAYADAATALQAQCTGKRRQALIFLADFTGLAPENFKTLHAALLAELGTSSLSPVSVVLKHLAPTYRGFALDARAASYQIEGLLVPAHSWQMIRALLRSEWGKFSELLDFEWVKTQERSRARLKGASSPL
jgi:hypothetical protein